MKYLVVIVSIFSISFIIFADKGNKIVKDMIYPKSSNGYYHLNKMPGEWQLLIEKDGEYTTVSPCPGAPETIKIRKTASPRIQKMGGTCGVDCRIVKITKSNKMEDNYSYTFTLDQCTSMCSGDKLNITSAKMYFIPGPDEASLPKNNCGLWLGDLFKAELIYVPEINIKNFPSKLEKCE